MTGLSLQPIEYSHQDHPLFPKTLWILKLSQLQNSLMLWTSVILNNKLWTFFGDCLLKGVINCLKTIVTACLLATVLVSSCRHGTGWESVWALIHSRSDGQVTSVQRPWVAAGKDLVILIQIEGLITVIILPLFIVLMNSYIKRIMCCQIIVCGRFYTHLFSCLLSILKQFNSKSKFPVQKICNFVLLFNIFFNFPILVPASTPVFLLHSIKDSTRKCICIKNI